MYNRYIPATPSSAFSASLQPAAFISSLIPTKLHVNTSTSSIQDYSKKSFLNLFKWLLTYYCLNRV